MGVKVRPSRVTDLGAGALNFELTMLDVKVLSLGGEAETATEERAISARLISVK